MKMMINRARWWWLTDAILVCASRDLEHLLQSHKLESSSENDADSVTYSPTMMRDPFTIDQSLEYKESDSIFFSTCLSRAVSWSPPYRPSFWLGLCFLAIVACLVGFSSLWLVDRSCYQCREHIFLITYATGTVLWCAFVGLMVLERRWAEERLTNLIRVESSVACLMLYDSIRLAITRPHLAQTSLVIRFFLYIVLFGYGIVRCSKWYVQRPPTLIDAEHDSEILGNDADTPIGMDIISIVPAEHWQGTGGLCVKVIFSIQLIFFCFHV